MRVDLGGYAIEAEWVGPPPGAAPSLIFLHDGLGSVSTWKRLPAEIVEATGFGALVYSRRGYGASDPAPLPRPVRYMHDEAEGALPRVLDAFGIERAVLFGHSDGGSIALVYAGARPDDPRLIGLVLEAPHVFCEPISVESIRAAAVAFEQGDLRERLERHHGSNTEGAFWGWNRVWLDPAFLAWNIEEYLPRVRVPVLVVQGEDDEFGTIAQVDAIERGVRAPVERAVFAACGHTPHRDQPEQTRAVITRFLRELAPGLGA